jgi:hypothetical protein
LLGVAALGVLSIAGCAQHAGTPQGGAARPACPGPSWTTVPAALSGHQPGAFTIGQPVRVGIALTRVSNARVDQLRIDIVPASAHVQDGAGDGIPVSDGTEPHVARLRVTNPPPLSRQVLAFDGLDEQHRPVPAGEYQVYVVTTFSTAVDCGPLRSPSPGSPRTVSYGAVAMIGALSVSTTAVSPLSPASSPPHQ